jgi:hypothetical protein
MKSILYILLFFLFIQPEFITLNAQEEEVVPNFLFLFGQIGVSSQTTITHTLTVQSAYWNGAHNYSTAYEWREACATITGSTTNEPSLSCDTDWKGFYFAWGSSTCIPIDNIAYGLYKVTNSYNNDYFYIDLRDCKYAGGSYSPCNYYNPDFLIRYNESEGIFRWRRAGSPQSNPWNLISTGEILYVWDIKNNGTPPTTSTFEDYWDHALVVVKGSNNHPVLVYGPYPDDEFDLQYYKVQRFNNCNPSNGWQTIDEITNTYYEDESLEFCTATPPAECINECYYIYRIIAVDNQSNESDPINAVGLSLVGDPPQKINLGSYNMITGYTINQNFPNPFNPLTTISYSIPEDAKVTIKVYDMLGTEVAELVNETKPAGYYETVFNAANLNSGVYVYKITALKGDRILFSESKRMILLK